MPIIGHTSKLVSGWALGKRRSAEIAERALARALKTFDELGINQQEMILHQDRDSVYTGDEWVNRVYVQEDIALSYLMNGARGNTYMESFNGHFKNPVESIFTTTETLEKLKEKVEERVTFWNEKRLHGALENRTPMEFIREEI